MTNTRNNKQKKRLMTRKNNKKQQGGDGGMILIIVLVSFLGWVFLCGFHVLPEFLCTRIWKEIRDEDPFRRRMLNNRNNRNNRNNGGAFFENPLKKMWSKTIDFNKSPEKNGYTIVNNEKIYKLLEPDLSESKGGFGFPFGNNAVEGQVSVLYKEFKLYDTNTYHNIHYILYPVDNSKRDQVDLAFTLTILLNILLNNVKDNYYLTKCNSNIIMRMSNENLQDVIDKNIKTIANMLKINPEDFEKIKNEINLPGEIKKILYYINWLNENIITDATNCDKKGEKYLKKFMSRLNVYNNYIKYNPNPNEN